MNHDTKENNEALKNLKRWVKGEKLTAEEISNIEWLIAEFEVAND
jgi:hypothetical protein